MKNKNFFIFFVFLVFWNAFLFGDIFSGKEKKEKEVLSPIKFIEIYKNKNGVHPNDELVLLVRVELEKGWHIYHKFPGDELLIPTTFSLNLPKGIHIKKVLYPKPQKLQFSYSDKKLYVYSGVINFYLFLRVEKTVSAGRYPIKIILKYQACSDEQCLPPNQKEILTYIDVFPLNKPIMEENSELFKDLYEQASDSYREGDIFSKNIFLVLLLLFLGGLALNLTPCVYPIIPLTISFFSGYKKGKPWFLASLFLLGIVITYTIIGVVSALSGAMMGSILQNPIVIIIMVGIFFLLSLQMLGLKSFAIFEKYRNIGAKYQSRLGPIGAFFRGLLIGIVGAPCIGPFTLSLILYVQKLQDPVIGALYFFVLSLGLGIPYFFLAVFTTAIKRLPRSGNWMSAVDKVFALIMWLLAVYYAKPLIGAALFPYFIFLVVFVWLVVSFYLEKKQVGRFEKKNLIIIIFFGLIGIGYGFSNLKSKGTELLNWEMVRNDTNITNIKYRPTLFLFTAKWCSSCDRLKKHTLNDKAVVDFLSSFRLYIVDITKAPKGVKKELVDRFHIRGCPTIVCVNGSKVVEIAGYLDPDKFLEKIKSCVGGKKL